MPNDDSDAARFNRQVSRKLQKALQEDPEADLASKIPDSYAARLANRKAKPAVVEDAKTSNPNASPKHTRNGSRKSKIALVDTDNDLSSALGDDATVTVLDSPSPDVIKYLSRFQNSSPHDHQNKITNGDSFTGFVPNTAALF